MIAAKPLYTRIRNSSFLESINQRPKSIPEYGVRKMWVTFTSNCYMSVSDEHKHQVYDGVCDNKHVL